MSDSQSSYKQVIKATSLFGGVQVFNILISVARSKAIALFLGPAGMGIAGLFNAAIALINVATGFGLETSAVKSISTANADTDKSTVNREISVLKKLVWFTGLFGAVLTLLFSPLLSRLTFGNSDYTMAFVWLSAAILLKQLSTGQLAILQGLRRLRHMATANLLGSFFGLLVTVPLYYCYGISAIVPAIILSLGLSAVVGWWFVRQVKIPAVTLSNSQTFSEGKAMLKLGLSLSFITLLTSLAAYVLQVYIGYAGGLQQVGFFTAGFAIINSYVGLIFNAMSTDYFPRLAAVAQDHAKVRTVVMQQAFIAILIITPIIIVFLALAPFVVQLLYSKEFLAIVAMVSWGILGMLFKAVSWSMGYILIAKGDSRLFIKTSLGFNSVFLLVNVAGYYFYGLEGLGISFLVNYLIHFFALKVITKAKYDFYFEQGFYKVFAVCLLLFGITFLFSYLDNVVLKYGLMAVIAVISVVYSLYELNKKVNLKDSLNRLTKKKNDTDA